MPGVVEATVPEPLPALVTFNVLMRAKLAVTDLAALIVALQTPVPEHAPDQPANFEPTDGVAVNATLVP